MRCPNCQGDFEAIAVKGWGGIASKTKRCNQCGGFWFERNILSQLSAESAKLVDPPMPNFSLQEYNFACPIDGTMMTELNGDDHQPGIRYWDCPECQGLFVPRGQLGVITHWLEHQSASRKTVGPGGRTKWVESVVLLGVGAIFSLIAFNVDATKLSASTANPLPTSGPNITALILLALTYLAGTILAVLGRKTPIIFMGWSVIVICLFGFAVIVFGP